MSDATKLIIGIVLAVVVIALIVWLFASARRREVDARRMEAEAVRARLAERVPVVQEREDRASVTAQIAEDARREAEAAAAEAARLEREAAEHRKEAERLRDEQASLAREADRLDPDVRTDEEGYRVDDSGRRLTGSTVASAFGAGAAALEQDDEPDLADHENPFPGYAAEPATARDAQSVPGGSEDADWVNSPVDEDAADEVEAQAARDAEAADWINGPDDVATAESEHSTGPGPVSSESSAHDLPSAAAGQAAESEHSTVSESSVQNLPPSSEGDDPDWVNSPVDEDAADEVEAQAARDAEAADWVNGPEDVATAESGHSAVPGSAVSPESSAQDLSSAVAGRPDGAESEHSTGLEPSDDEGAPSDDEGAPFDAEDQGPVGRRISGLEEVVDGGYGVGSAAPIADGAQPLGHPVMGFRDSMTFTREGEGAAASDPDVWFYDEEAARRSGFRPADGE